MTDFNNWNQQIVDEFRANDGVVGGPFEGAPLLLLHHRGAKSGTARVNPLAYQDLGNGAVAIFASKGGAPTHPDWYFNLVAHPEVTIEVGTKSYDAVARVATGEERARIWATQKKERPVFAEYEIKAPNREIPVVVLDPA